MRALLALFCLLPWVTSGPVAAQEQIELWEDPMISVVWPHDGNGNPTSVNNSRMVNVSIWPSSQVSCCDEPPTGLAIAKDNEPTEWLGDYNWDTEVMERTVDGITFSSAEFNNIPADLDDLARLLQHPDDNWAELLPLWNEKRNFRIMNSPLVGDGDHI